ncbi:hypothetical protein [Streptomyces sp. NPDC059009]|uniref:hypothetical protein n=1 Tax=Streptomyces sp. NPDC059009 TaxID=3346694 RepID=UPI0036B66056
MTRQVDGPQAPVSPGAWDTRSEEVLAEGALTPGSDDGGAAALVADAFGALPEGVAERAGEGAELVRDPGAWRAGPEKRPAPRSAGVAARTAGADARIAAVKVRAVEAMTRTTAVKAPDDTVETRATAAKVPTVAKESKEPLATKAPKRRGAADPVKALMHRHRELCERAVDPLEIAAALESHGVTDRTAARFRHRDVFSLAEEMYARVPRDEGAGTVGNGELPASDPDPNAPSLPPHWALLALLPGLVCALVVAGLAHAEGQARLAVGLGGALAVWVALRVALRFGPLRAAHPAVPATRAWVCFLLAYALFGDGLLRAAVAGGPDGPWPSAPATALGLALAVAPAAWCARVFAVRARGRLGASRGLDEFAVSVRPLLLGAFGLYVGVLALLLVGSGALLDGVFAVPEPGAAGASLAGALALGALLMLARLLAVHGFPRAPVVLLRAAGLGELAALALVFAGRVPGCGFLSAPVESAVDTWGAGCVPAVLCGGAALVLLIHAVRTLTTASAHARPGDAA